MRTQLFWRGLVKRRRRIDAQTGAKMPTNREKKGDNS